MEVDVESVVGGGRDGWKELKETEEQEKELYDERV